MLARIEFFTSPDGTVSYVADDLVIRTYTQSCTVITDFVVDAILDRYPSAYAALSELYRKHERNRRFFRYRIAHRFIRCNFGEFDTLRHDISGDSVNVEEVRCPLRGECQFEGVICRPRVRSCLTAREVEVVKGLAGGMRREELAVDLGIAISTLFKHIAHIKAKLRLENAAQIVKYYHENK